jgi:DNA-binding response OmpR family regulator
MKILVLEDDHLLNEAITKYIETTGHIVTNFRDGDKAFISIKNNSYDMLILDINVPGLDGFELLEAIHELKIQIPTIYISALADIEDISRAFVLGCHDYLKKPFHLKELTIRIDKILQSSYIHNLI